MDQQNPENLDCGKTSLAAQDTRRPMLSAMILSPVLAALRYLLAVLVVCLAILALQIMARESWNRLQEHRPQSLLSNKMEVPVCQLDALPGLTENPVLTISGQARRDGKYTVHVNAKVLGPFYADGNGHFEMPVTLARQVNSISVKCEKEREDVYERTTAIYEVLLSPESLRLPEIRSAMPMPEGRLLLVGTTDAGSNVSLSRKEQDHADSTSYADKYGIFELIVNADIVQHAADYDIEIINPRLGKRLRGDLKTALGKVEPGFIERRGSLDLAAEKREVEFEITAPVSYPYFTKLLAGDMAPERLVDSFVSSWMTSGESRWSAVTTPEGRMTVRVHAQVLPSFANPNTYEFRPASSLLSTENDTFTLTWDEQPPRWFEPVPTLLEPRKAVWKGPLASLYFNAGAMRASNGDPRATPPPLPAEAAASPPPPPPAPTLRQLLRSFSFPSLISPFAHAILIFLPFGWLLYTLRTRKDFCAFQIEGRTDVSQQLGVAILLLGVLALRGPVSALIDELVAYLAQGLWFRNSSAAVLMLWLAFISAIPLVARQLAERMDPFEVSCPSGSVSKLLRPIILRGALGIALVAASAMLWKNGWISSLFSEDDLQGLVGKLLFGISEPGVLTIFVVLFAFADFNVFVGYVLIWLAGAAGSQLLFISWQPDFPLSATIIAAATIATAAILPIRRIWYPKILGNKPWHRFAAIAMLFAGLAALEPNTFMVWLGGLLAAWTYLWLCLFILQAFRSPAHAQTMEEKLSIWGLYLLTAILCYPNEKVAAEFWRVGYLLNHLNSMSKYLALLMVLRWLYQESKKGVRYERDHDVWLAASLFAFFLVGSAAYVLYIPVSLLVAYLMTRQWLFQPAASPTEETPYNCADRKAAIEKLIHARWLKGLLWSYTRMQDKKLQKGEITLSQHTQTLEEFKREARQLGHADKARAEAVWQSALNGGPDSSAWQNAVTAIKYAFPLALAPLFLDIYRFTADEWNSPYPILAFIFKISLTLCFWLSIAWFFGYFYRYIRGTSGLSKGVNLAITMVVPYLCLRLLALETATELSSFFIWAGQIFVYTTVLGLLAFDYETLRLCGLSWPQLTAIYRIPTLSAFGSVLVGALVSILIALVEGKTLNWANFALSFIGQLFPDVKVDQQP